MNVDSHLLAALVMDDYDNRVPTDQVFPNIPFRDTLNAEGRLREVGLNLGIQRAQLETALTYARERVAVLDVQRNERFARHVPSEVLEGRDVLLRVDPTEEDMRMAAVLGVNTTTMQVNIDPTVYPPVAEVSAPAFSGPAHELVVEEPKESGPAAASATEPATTTPTVTKATPKSPPANILPPQSSEIPKQPSFLMRMTTEEEWLEMQVAMLRDGPMPWFLPHEYGTSPDSTPSVPVLPTIPQDTLSQDTDLSMWSAPLSVANDSQSYKPIPHAIIGFDLPVSSMSDLVPPTNDHVFTPIQWNADCVTPPYEEFYLDGCRLSPFRAGLTGYEALPLSYKGPMVEEEYWNRMIALWKSKNEFRREQAQMIAQMKGVPLEFGEFGVMPYYKKAPQTHHVRRFQLGKLKLMLKDIEEEKEAIRQRADEDVDAVADSLREAEHASRLIITATTLGQLGNDTTPPDADPDGTATVMDANSPKHIDEVDELEADLPALQTHAAQLAANQAADGASAGSAEIPTSAANRAALQRRAKLKISPRPIHAPMEAVPEEQAHASDAGSYLSTEEPETPDEQSEQPPEE
eukprot:6192714-Amphidinium_carterae.2